MCMDDGLQKQEIVGERNELRLMRCDTDSATTCHPAADSGTC